LYHEEEHGLSPRYDDFFVWRRFTMGFEHMRFYGGDFVAENMH